LLEAWFAIAATGWAPTTIRQTRSVLERYLHTRLGDVPVGDVTPAMIDSTFAALRRGGGLHGRPLSTGTLARVHVVLRAAFSQAMRWGWIWDNPAERAHRLVTVSRELLPPTPAELRLLLNYVAARDLQMHAFLVLAAVTGARRAQLLGLRWQNVHLTVRRISFSAGWVEGPDGPVLSATKTKRRHVVDLDAGTVQVVANLAAERGCAARAEAFVFSDDAGATAWKPNRVTKAFCDTVAPPACDRSDSTISAISWRPRCSMRASPSSLSPDASTTTGFDNAGPVRPRCARRRRPGGDPLADHAIKRLMPPASKSSGRP
jgi:integrase